MIFEDKLFQVHVPKLFHSACGSQNDSVHVCVGHPLCFSIFLGELGDYDPMRCRMGYLSEYQFFPGQVCNYACQEPGLPQ